MPAILPHFLNTIISLIHYPFSENTIFNALILEKRPILTISKASIPKAHYICIYILEKNDVFTEIQQKIPKTHR